VGLFYITRWFTRP